MNQKEINKEVYQIVKQIPEGKVITYGQIARLIGKPQCSRHVGNAMHNAPRELDLPCHRVVNSQGKTTPIWKEQRELLEKENIAFKKNGCIDIKKYGWEEINELYKEEA